MADLRFSEIVGFIKSSLKGAPNGVAPLDSNSKVPLANLPPLGDGGGGNSNLFSFQVNFDGAGAPSTVTELPTGWTSQISGNIVNITHTVGVNPKFISYLGYSTGTGSGTWRYRVPTAANEMFVVDAIKTTVFSFIINTSVTAADLNGKAIVNVNF